ncbi:phage tail terminator-like protein [Sphingobium sp. UBA5915]|uniref:phage tail terminator-like protein n=1 Tax=Sphingobium sp. UBA5915 TaxID=1947530 RepID=UPI0025E7ED60|nr:phage tail terminator-like protein [Sphingobium sp. UBA5915]
MPSIETTDWLALRSRVDTLITDPVIPIYDPGALVTPPKDGSNNPLPFILLSDATNDPQRIGLSSRGIHGVDHIRTGTLMLTLQWPIARDVSHAQIKEIAGQIAAHFPADACMTYGQSRLRVTQDAAAMQAYVGGAYRVAVVRVFWSSI